MFPRELVQRTSHGRKHLRCYKLRQRELSGRAGIRSIPVNVCFMMTAFGPQSEPSNAKEELLMQIGALT